MKTLGSYPGANMFHLSLMIVIIAILVVVFLAYVDDAEREIETASVSQTKRIIDSSLAVEFAEYAVNGRLDELDRLAGGNPFVLLARYRLLPTSYRGELDGELHGGLPPGWYFLKQRGLAAYKSRFADADRYFELVLNYEDLNRSGGFEAHHDKFVNLQFVRAAAP